MSNSSDFREVPNVRGVVEGDADKVGKNGQKVYDVHQGLYELGLDGGRYEPNLYIVEERKEERINE